jgi:hypothetical protein
MSITYDMILKNVLGYNYSLESQAGIKMYEFAAHDDSEAMKIAQAYMSSWSSVKITLKDKDGQRKEGN